MQPSSEACETEDRCFRVSVARRLMLPHPAAPNAEVLIAGMQDVIQSHNGAKVFIEQDVLLSPVLSTDRLNTHGWILSLTLTVRSHIWMCPLLLPSLAICPWSQQPGQNQDLWNKFDRYPHINLVPFILETTGRSGPHA